mgnify:FL=1
MRENIYNFSANHAKITASKEEISATYRYEIFLPSGELLRLDSSSVNLIKGEFNDSAENIIILIGVFEENTITKEMNLTGSKIKIFSVFDGVSSVLVTYFITEFEKNDLDFTIKCEPETTKYRQSLLLLYSKTCRTNFGDNKCGVNLDDYKKSYKIESINPKNIVLTNVEAATGYYNQGFAWFENELKKIIRFKIITHNDNEIELEENLPVDLLKQEYVVLSPNCDKNFITCCNKFNNAVNFRGEPTIATINVIPA